VAVDKVEKQQPVVSETATPAEKFNLVVYLKEVREELDKVVWPSREQLISESAAVFLMVLISTLFLFGVNSLFHALSTLIF
jgi:preprotein translocase subunit SecE